VFRQVDQVSREITRNILAAPLLIEGEAIGVIEVINTIDRPAFSEHDLEIFESFSDSVAIALQRRRLLDSIQRTNVQLERRLREITSLHAVARAQVEERTIQDLFARALNIVRDDLKVGRASILMASGSTLKMAASAGTYDESDATPGSGRHFQSRSACHENGRTPNFEIIPHDVECPREKILNGSFFHLRTCHRVKTCDLAEPSFQLHVCPLNAIQEAPSL
jgi:hypothetical protein